MKLRIIHTIRPQTEQEHLHILDGDDDTPARDFCVPGEKVESDIFVEANKHPSIFPIGHSWGRV
jgi:hypothetical protein